MHMSQVKRGQRGIEGATQRHTVHYQEKRVEFFETPESRNRTGGAPIATPRNLNADGESQRAAQVPNSPGPELISSAHLDCSRNFVRRFRETPGQHLHPV